MMEPVVHGTSIAHAFHLINGFLIYLVTERICIISCKKEKFRSSHQLTKNVFVCRGIRDLKNHTAEMCELRRTLDNEMKLQEFLGVKGQFREMVDLNAKKEAERQAKREEKQNKIAAFTQILQTIKQFTGIIYSYLK